MANCSTHDQVPATLKCAECGRYLCDMCVRNLEVNQKRIPVCGVCGGMTVVPREVIAEEEESTQRGFWSRLPQAITYPFRGFGLVTMITGTLFYAAIQLASRVLAFSPFTGFLTIMISIVVTGYVLQYYSTVIQQAAKGSESPPVLGEVEFSDYHELAATFFRFVGVFVLCLLPSILLFVYSRFLTPELRETWNDGYVPAVLLVASMFFFPMAFLAVSYYESIHALNPVLIVKSMRRAFGHYVVVVMYFYLLIYVGNQSYYLLGLSKLSEMSLMGGALAALLHRFILLYMVTSVMYLLGVFLYCNKARLNWQ